MPRSIIISVLLVLILVLGAGIAGATKHTVTTSGFTFVSATITITEGDTVVFSIAGIHNAQEVSQATWDVDGTTPLGGGFSVPFGGGQAIPSGVGTHYYVCQAHVGGTGMKGRIIVESASPPPGTVVLSSIVDRDAILGTSADRVGKNWSMKLYKDSIGSGIVMDSVASAWTLTIDSLEAGTYVAVEADSLSWTHISQTLDGISQGPTGLNFKQIVLGAGEVRTLDFLNYAPNVVISVGFTFQPDTISVDSSDTVRFVLDPMHNAREVDSVTWLADDTVSNGGFETPYGGGDVVLSEPGKFWYVCVPHGTEGMKGVILVRTPGAFSVPVAAGWNLLSLPAVPADNGVSSLYPTATSPAFTYHIGYQTESTVNPGEGYWLKFAVPQSVDIDGATLLAETVAVSQGWNIVGGLSSPVAVSSITSDPGGLITSVFSGYQAGYFTADTLQPGYGYWVKVGASGSLILEAAPGPAPSAGRIRIVPVPEVPHQQHH